MAGRGESVSSSGRSSRAQRGERGWAGQTCGWQGVVTSHAVTDATVVIHLRFLAPGGEPCAPPRFLAPGGEPCAPPLSISTVVPKSGPPRYDDEIASNESFFAYRYRDNGPQSFDNRLLRQAYRERSPLIYFRGIAPALHGALWPCFITHDDPIAGLVNVEVGDAALDALELRSPEIDRRYVMRAVRQRLHQQQFRRIVLTAYRERCTICSLHETRLLQAAHIVADRDQRGLAEVPNGLSLCSIHHGAFDANLLGISPDLSVQLSPRLMDDEDGPMLEQGLKAFHGSQINVPRREVDHPSRDYLEERFAAFRAAA